MENPYTQSPAFNQGSGTSAFTLPPRPKADYSPSRLINVGSGAGSTSIDQPPSPFIDPVSGQGVDGEYPFPNDGGGGGGGGGDGEGLPDGSDGDLLYNNGANWVPLSPPDEANAAAIYWDGDSWEFAIAPEIEGEESKEAFLYWDGTEMKFEESKEFDICENGQPKIYKIPAIEKIEE
jgi:hypothetical protein